VNFLPDSENICDTYPRYRLDLQLGIPYSKLQGALEWWMGDTGLCRDPDNHPYLVLGEICSQEWGNIQDVMEAVTRSSDASGPIQVSARLVSGGDLFPELSSYQIFPSPGLRSFIFLLAYTCPLIISPNSLAGSIIRGEPAPFSTIEPLAPDRGTAHPHRMKGTIKSGSHTNQRSLIAEPPKKDENEQVIVEILRIILRKEGYPVAEFDLSRKEWLPTSKSVQRKNAKQSLYKFRIEKGYQLSRSACKDIARIFVMSDLHLGHANSIPRYKRPFLPSDPGEMDRVLIRNWNWTVNADDTIVFLGDLSYMGSTPSESYLQRLRGKIFFLEGNHDPYYPYMSHCLLMRYKGVRYLFIHDPEEMRKPFDGWVIHGHVHNKDLLHYPFFNPHMRTVNVCAEMVGYRPISLDEIHDLVIGMQDIVLFRDLSLTDDTNRVVSGEHDSRLPVKE